MILVNLTPHPINVYDSENNLIKVFESEGVVRVSEKIIPLYKEVDGCPLVVKSYGSVMGLPEPRPGVYFIVSTIVTQSEAHRKDLVVPSEPVRDDKGVMIGCRSFSVTM